MNSRQRKKALCSCLAINVEILNRKLYGEKKYKTRYKVSTTPLHIPMCNRKAICYLDGKIKIEIRAAEEHHNVAHFHVTKPGEGSGSYRIDNLSRLQSSLRPSTERTILKWASENQQLLKQVWNEYHGKRIYVN